MDWVAFKTAVQSFVVAASELPSEMVVWADERQPHIAFGDASRVVLDIVSDRAVGPIEERRDGTGATLVITYTVQHVARISVRAECLTHAGDGFAMHWLSRVAARMQRDNVRSVYKDAGIALVSIEETRKLPQFEVDGRTYSMANLDLLLSYVQEETDSSHDGNWIETIEVNSPFQTNQNPIVIP